ncbi:MAG TPA: pilin [Parcubacteria group bacterium]|nr:pilin [Parcubacteria group bacterium]
MKKLLYTALALGPSVAFAQTLGGVNTLLDSISRLVDTALPVVVGLALLAFFWGLMKFIFAAGNEDNKEDGKRIMIYGLIGLFVMVAVWGLVGFIADNLNVDTGGSANVPTVPGL